MPSVESDNEVQAIQGVISALSLVENDEARGRVLEYAIKRFGLRAPVSSGPEPPGSGLAMAERKEEPPVAPIPKVLDIRSLKEQRKPRSANEMAALVAYYLSELAPGNEKKQEITTADVKKYFKQAQFKPEATAFTLPNAKGAGYLDAIGKGQYRLNPVGYNLVVYNLPGEATTPPGKTRTVRAGRKSKSGSSRIRKSRQAKTLRQRGA